jgi:enamine deaminase RidA (YjgF/YER057c/UK114 family)
VFLAGQVARNSDGEIAGPGDLTAQVEQAYLNVAAALASVGASFDDVAKLTLYVVDWASGKMAGLAEGIDRAARQLGIDPLKPGTLIGVAALSEPALLVEVDAIAVLP